MKTRFANGKLAFRQDSYLDNGFAIAYGSLGSLMVVILSKLLSDNFNNNIYLSALAFAKAAHFAFQNATFLGKHFLKPLANPYFIFQPQKACFGF